MKSKLRSLLKSILIKLRLLNLIKKILNKRVVEKFKRIVYPLNLPIGYSEAELLDYLVSFKLDDDVHGELEGYLREDFKRFLYTLELIPRGEGKLLEIGSNPYFISILVEKFLDYKTFRTNFFGDLSPEHATQTMKSDLHKEEYAFNYINHNIENSKLPFDEKFDIVLFCEVFEHFTNDPMEVLLRIKESLTQDGVLILTTPNVNRLENVAKMIAGANIYDPYSGYGPYGRHNREYNKHELVLLLTHLGFEIEVIFSSDVHENRSHHFCDLKKLSELLSFRENDLGQYIFIKARNVREANLGKPTWLYRSYPADQLSQ